MSSSNVKSATQRPMLSERTCPVMSTAAGRVWDTTPAPITATSYDYTTSNFPTANQFGFYWISGAAAGSDDQDQIERFMSPPWAASWRRGPVRRHVLNHPGVVIVTFFDGHTESIADSTPCATTTARRCNRRFHSGQGPGRSPRPGHRPGCCFRVGVEYEGRLRPFSARGGLRPGVYAG